MILTPIPPDRLPEILGDFSATIDDSWTKQVLAGITATSCSRAEGTEAEAHRLEALALAHHIGMGSLAGPPSAGFSWDGLRLRADTEAYVLLHEIAHYQLASPARRKIIDFGLGPGPETGDRAGAERAAILAPAAREREEAAASLLGIIWETALGHPALASFLDQNWLEGAGTPTASWHFTAVLHALRQDGFIDLLGRPLLQLRSMPDPGESYRAFAAAE